MTIHMVHPMTVQCIAQDTFLPSPQPRPLFCFSPLPPGLLLLIKKVFPPVLSFPQGSALFLLVLTFPLLLLALASVLFVL